MTAYRKPEIIVFAGPNGSGKSTITEAADTVGKYINADDIKKALNCSDLEAAELADDIRRKCVEHGEDFTFETVLSTHAKLEFLSYAKSRGYFIKKRKTECFIWENEVWNKEQIYSILKTNTDQLG